jgi:hypothetical protein
MGSLFRLVCTGILGLLLVAGCAKAPTQEVADAKSQVEAVTTEDTKAYAAAELDQLNKDLAAAEEEVKLQSDKLFGNFDKAKEMLAAIKGAAENVSSVAAQKKEAERKAKEEAMNAAVAAQAQAAAAIDAAKTLLATVPVNKRTKAQIETINADLLKYGESISGIQALIDQEKFSEGVDSARLIKENAETVTGQVQAIIEQEASRKKK